MRQISLLASIFIRPSTSNGPDDALISTIGSADNTPYVLNRVTPSDGLLMSALSAHLGSSDAGLTFRPIQGRLRRAPAGLRANLIR